MSLVARHLEANGIPTVILGSALDIVEHCRVARFAFVDFPLGNPCGKPYDVSMQRDIVATALGMFETATAPNNTASAAALGRQRLARRLHGHREEDVAALQRKGEARRAERQALRDAGRVRGE